jgi:hypothetical protein
MGRTIKTVCTALLALSVLSGPLPFFRGPATAHGWYPKECCSHHDCAPVESVAQVVPVSGGLPQLLVTSRFGRAIIPHDFPVRESKDARMHICMSHVDLICFFMPPGM